LGLPKRDGEHRETAKGGRFPGQDPGRDQDNRQIRLEALDFGHEVTTRWIGEIGIEDEAIRLLVPKETQERRPCGMAAHAAPFSLQRSAERIAERSVCDPDCDQPSS